MGIAHQVVKKTAVGSKQTISNGSAAISLEAFQGVVAELEGLEKVGTITIVEKHKESSTGNRFVDYVQFQRLA